MFVLLEKVNKIEIKNRETDLQSSKIKYQTIEAFLGLGDDEPGYKKIDTDNSIEEHPDLINIDRNKADESAEQPMNASPSSKVELQESIIAEGNDGNEKSFEKSLVTDKDEIPCPSPISPQPKLELKRKVAFISIGKPKVPQTSESSLLNNMPTANSLPTDKTHEEDPFFSLLTAGNVKDSLF
ncbi:hypothetical protein MKW94_017313 [Papaver nudicaule]|uniref:Uncharacterized protein n=1 Tax=Papaver nudicaule TaxID=74823 RepID=A0AA42AQL7_PAPNU|nr:hypothetical protein [Papaver nudicaule]